MGFFGRNLDNAYGSVSSEYRIPKSKQHKRLLNAKHTKKSARHEGRSVLSFDDLKTHHRPTIHNYGRSVYGPYDYGEVKGTDDHIDLGALLVYPHPEMNMSLEYEEATQTIISVKLEYQDSTLQLQAFAAPKTAGVWDEIRRQLIVSAESQHGATSQVKGLFGTELLVNLPSSVSDTYAGYRQARFVGIDGPRWFLRGVFGGRAALDKNAATLLEDNFRSVIVYREDRPLPPKDLLPLTIPDSAVIAQKESEEGAHVEVQV